MAGAAGQLEPLNYDDDDKGRRELMIGAVDIPHAKFP